MLCHAFELRPVCGLRSAGRGGRAFFLHWLIRGMAGRLDAESNDIAAQITDYKSTLCARRPPSPDVIGEDRRTCMPRTVSSCLKDQTLKMKLVWDKVQLGLLGATMHIFLTGGEGRPFLFSNAQIPNSICCTSWVPWSTWHTVPLLGRCGPNPPIQSFNSHPIVPPAWTRGYPLLRAIAAFNTCL